MRKEDKEIVKLTIKQILLFFLDVTAGFTYLSDLRNTKRKTLREYVDWRASNYDDFRKQIHYLKKKKLINIIVENKEKYLVPTKKGRDRIKKYFIDGLKIKEFEKWDGKWRVVVFDVPNDKNIERDMFRRKLLNLGFFQLQESVFVYPFDCKEEIDFLKKIFYLKPYVQFLVADMIETEKDLMSHFFEQEILTKENVVHFTHVRKTIDKSKK